MATLAGSETLFIVIDVNYEVIHVNYKPLKNKTETYGSYEPGFGIEYRTCRTRFLTVLNHDIDAKANEQKMPY